MATDFSVVEDRLAEKSVNSDYGSFLTIGGGIALVGIVLFVMALMGEGSHRAWQTFHVNWLFFTSLTGGSIAITAVYKIANAKWSGVILRLSQAVSGFIPVSLIGLALIFTFGYQDIYGNMQAALHGVSPGKALWLSKSWMAARLFIGLGVLYYLGIRLIRSDMLPDLVLAKEKVSDGRKARYERMLAGYNEAENHTRIYRLAAIFAAVYALVFTIVAFDGIMSLQPHWFSNLLGGWFFMGSFLGAHMLLGLMVIFARNNGAKLGEFISPKQRHDLGKLCFGFTVFWTYLMWAQFLVIWYGNLPEETGFVFARLWGPWRVVGSAVFLGMFVLPFTGLLGVGPKKTPAIFGAFATISLCALWLERYLLVMPSVTAEAGPVFGLPEIGPTLTFLGLFIACIGWFARTYPMVSPRLALITLQKEAAH
ncbi:MAG: hypothetical protein V4558_12085 [Gemmatimonadota bacterium]